MALGVEMLLQSMGFDPKEIQAKFGEARDNLAAAMKHFDTRLTTMEAKLDRLLAVAESDNMKEDSRKAVTANGR